jgi:hypothetical protein
MRGQFCFVIIAVLILASCSSVERGTAIGASADAGTGGLSTGRNHTKGDVGQRGVLVARGVRQGWCIFRSDQGLYEALCELSDGSNRRVVDARNLVAQAKERYDDARGLASLVKVQTEPIGASVIVSCGGSSFRSNVTIAINFPEECDSRYLRIVRSGFREEIVPISKSEELVVLKLRPL